MSKDAKGGKGRIFADLVALHQSITSDAPKAVPAAAEKVPAPADEDAAFESDDRFELFCEHLPMGVLLAEVGRDRYRHPE